MSGAVHWTTLSALRAQAPREVLDAPVVAVMPWLRHAAAQQAAQLMVSRAGAPLQVLAVQDDLGAGPMAIWNAALPLTRGEYFIYCAEDAFAGRYWLRFALQAMSAQPNAGLLAFNDGKWFGQLAAFGMARRGWLATVYGGTLFHAGYCRHYGDTELTLIARHQSVLTYHPHALLVEVDHDKDCKPVDTQDRLLFMQRQAGGFDRGVPALTGLQFR